MMEILLGARLDGDRFEVASAGVRGWDNQPMDDAAATDLQRLGHVPGTFRSRRATAHLLDSADLILTATRAHRSDILAFNPRSLHRTFTLLEFAALADVVEATDPSDFIAKSARQRALAPREADIADPYRRGPEAHHRAAEQINAAIITIGDRLNGLLTT